LIGFGLMSCATLGEAIALGIRYLPTRVPFFSVRLVQLDGTVDIDVYDAFPLGRLRQFAVENFLVETAMLFNSLLDPAPARTWQSRAELHFEWSEPPWFERYRARLPRCHFDASANRIRCDAALLDEPIGTANAQTAQMIVQQCDAELARLGYAESIVERVRNLLICGAHGYPSVDDVARELHVSTRTLAQARGIRRNLFGAARRNPAARRAAAARGHAIAGRRDRGAGRLHRPREFHARVQALDRRGPKRAALIAPAARPVGGPIVQIIAIQFAPRPPATRAWRERAVVRRDRVHRHVFRQLAARDEPASRRIDREAARLRFGGRRMRGRVRAVGRTAIAQQLARRPLADIGEPFVGRQVQIRRPYGRHGGRRRTRMAVREPATAG
jgi:hypothetical protein